VSRWELVLDGNAVRIAHSVGDGVYGGESFIVWDEEKQGLASYYFTTAGFYTRGTIVPEADGKLLARETVLGAAGGAQEVEARYELLADGKMRVVTRMKRQGGWDAPRERIYSEEPTAKVILP
jgi:hypothetical protein